MDYFSFAPKTLRCLSLARPTHRGSGVPAQANGNARELVISTILLILMAAAGLYGEILSHL